MGEIAQLAPAELIEPDGVPSLHVAFVGGKQVETGAAERIVPVHPELRRLGLPTFVGSATVGWTSEKPARRVSQRPAPHLLIARARLDVVGLRTHERFVAVPRSAVTDISSKGGLVMACTGQGRLRTDLTMQQREERLDPRRFCRLDASHLVNLTRIVELVPWTHRRYRLVFGDAAKSELVMSRDVGRRLRKALKNPLAVIGAL